MVCCHIVQRIYVSKSKQFVIRFTPKIELQQCEQSTVKVCISLYMLEYSFSYVNLYEGDFKYTLNNLLTGIRQILL